MLRDRLRAGNLASAVLIATNAIWKYRYDGQDWGRGWTQPEWNEDAAWQQGPAVLGFGERYINTVLNYGTGPVPMTAYFRTVFGVENPQTTLSFWLRLLVDDGAVVYLNGMEILRRNMSFGSISHTSQPLEVVKATEYLDFIVEPGTLFGRTNVLAVEVHQEEAILGGDMSIDLELLTGVPRPSELLTEADVQAARRVLVYEGVPLPEEILAAKPRR